MDDTQNPMDDQQTPADDSAGGPAPVVGDNGASDDAPAGAPAGNDNGAGAGDEPVSAPSSEEPSSDEAPAA